MNLSHTPVGASVLHKYREEYNANPHPVSWSHWVCISPYTKDTQSWLVGYKGELATAEAIQPLLDKGWTVLHSVPIGTRGSDIDHILISPHHNIYTLNTKHHPEKKVTRSKKNKIYINGSATHHIRNSVYEAARVSELFNTDTYSSIIFINAGTITLKELTDPSEPTPLIFTPTNLVKNITQHDNQHINPLLQNPLPRALEHESWTTTPPVTFPHEENTAWLKTHTRKHIISRVTPVLYGVIAYLIGWVTLAHIFDTPPSY